MADDDTKFAPPPRDGSGFRALVGLLVLVGALAGFMALYFVEIPNRNVQPLLLALGFVMGWAGSVVSSEFGASTIGRKAANTALDQIGSSKP